MKKILLFILLFICMAAAQESPWWTGLRYLNEDLLYGRWELRIKLAKGSGIVDCFILVDDNRETDSTWREIDIIEVLGHAMDSVWASVHLYNTNTLDERPWLQTRHHYPFGLDEEYHTYALEWTPDRFVWELDGVVYRKDEVVNSELWVTTYATGAPTKIVHEKNSLNSVAGFRDHPMRCAFDVWKCGSGGVEWCGVWNDSSYNKKCFYSWFKAYDYTPGTGDNGTDFTLVDYDDFNGSWDTNRWDVGYDMQYSSGKSVEVMVGTGKEISVPLYGEYKGEVPFDPGDTAASEPSNFPNYSSVKEVRQQQFQQGAILKEHEGRITFHVNVPGEITISMYNTGGRKVRVLTNSFYERGEYSLSLKDFSFASGTYVLNMETEQSCLVKRMISTGSR